MKPARSASSRGSPRRRGRSDPSHFALEALCIENTSAIWRSGYGGVIDFFVFFPRLRHKNYVKQPSEIVRFIIPIGIEGPFRDRDIVRIHSYL
jgi:hypothetical protein